LTAIENMTKETIINKQLPINELLDNSFNYPSSGFDGGIIKYYGKEIQSYFYCDYATGEEVLLRQSNDFRGYNLLALRPIRQDELVPNGWRMPFNIVQQAEVIVIERLVRYSRTLHSSINIIWPIIDKPRDIVWRYVVEGAQRARPWPE
jgi:hypothetical protein